MDRNLKLLGFYTFLALALGTYLIWSGLKTYQATVVQASPLPVQEIAKANQESSAPAVIGIEGEKVLVSKVIDGDTIEINGGARVRYIGIDTPETKDPRRPVECFGKQSALKNKELTEGKVVILQKDISETDKYNRLLRYVFLPLEDGKALFINDYLIREGFATVLSYPPDVKYVEQFLEAQQQAKKLNKGLWREC